MLIDPPTLRNVWVRGIEKDFKGMGDRSPPLPLRFTFAKQNQGVMTRGRAHEESSRPSTPPGRKAGKGVGQENSDGEEESSQNAEQNPEVLQERLSLLR